MSDRDRNPKVYTLSVMEVGVNVTPGSIQNKVIIQFEGHLRPKTKANIIRALKQGNYEVCETKPVLG